MLATETMLPESEHEWVDADLTADEEAGKHRYRSTPELGIRDMQRRLAVLRERLALVRDRGSAADEDEEIRLMREITQTLQLQQHYETLKNRN